MSSAKAQQLFSELSGPVYRYLLRMTGSGSRAEELTQDTFVRIVRALPTYQSRGRDRAWVFAIARNVALNHRRGQTREPAALTLAEEAAAAPDASPATRIALVEALAGLGESDRDAFLLRELGGLDYAEIATVTKLSVDAVRNRIYRARRALRQTLRPAAVEDTRGEIEA